MSHSRLLYGATIFLSAFLLFMVEPMAAKELLPALGGSSAVWITCLVLFQLALLLGYLYAHWLTVRADQWAVNETHPYFLVMAVAAVLVTLRMRPVLTGGAAHPVRTIFVSLALTVGLPLLVLASTSPLLQVWLARETTGPVPYRLFALSNAGSLLALAFYPTLIEPHLSLHNQRTLWAIGFCCYALLVRVIMAINRRHTVPLARSAPRPDPTPGNEPPSPLRSRLLWFVLPMVAAMQLSAVTAHLTQNIAAIPLLWTVPLAVYLLSFIFAFELPRLYHRGIVVRFLIVMLAGLAYALSKTNMALPISLAIAFYLIEAFLACYFLHAETHALRPRRASEATTFYLLIAGGGVAGSFFVGIASPLIFRANYDLAVTFFVTAFAGLLIVWPGSLKDMWPQRLLWTVLSGLLFALIGMLHQSFRQQSLMQARNFYGSLRVKQVDTPAAIQPVRVLLNGTIEHGTQSFAPGISRVPTTYYAEASGAGLALRLCCGAGAEQRPRRIGRQIGVVGLGAGTLAAYARAGDTFHFYEINPLVRPVAEGLFTYLRDARSAGASLTFSIGDARASLTAEPAQNFDVLIVDAFSGDAVPLHLLTTQAMQVYRRNLARGGIIAFHVSNQYVDLAPEIARLATASGMSARQVENPTEDTTGAYLSDWILVTGNSEFLNLPEIAAAVQPIRTVPGLTAWTDDYSSLLPVIRWGRR
jgi:hypothetical protein